MGLTLETVLVATLCLALIPLAVHGGALLDARMRQVADQEISDMLAAGQSDELYAAKAQRERAPVLATSPARAIRLARYLDAESRRLLRLGETP